VVAGGGLRQRVLFRTHAFGDAFEQRRGHVALAGVGEHGEDHGAFGGLLGDLHRDGEGRAGRDADEDAFLLRELAGPLDALRSGDRDQLIQVFLNLVRNAVDALPEAAGEITITTGYRPGVKFGTGTGGERVSLPLEVTVRDNGAGVPADLLPHIFDPFVTTKPRGSGLGLALVAKIVGDHGGVVECDSVPGRTIFRVLLPQARGEEAS